jgi:hypothetical protein
MKKSIKVALVALLAILPFSYVSAAPISDTVKTSISAVVSSNSSTADASMADLIAALKAEIKVQGIDGVKSITAQVMANAKDSNSAKLLAKAMSTAALMVAKELEEDLSSVAGDVASGISEGTPSDLKADAIASAADAAGEVGGPSVAEVITTEGATVAETPEVVTPSGDAGDTPSVDLSADTGVSK